MTLRDSGGRRATVEALCGAVRRHLRAGRAHQQVAAQCAAVEERDELLVVAPFCGVGEHEALELLVTFPPRRRAVAQERVEVVEVGFDDGVADLVRPGEVAHRPECDPPGSSMPRVSPSASIA
jgi:hypothetical protein